MEACYEYLGCDKQGCIMHGRKDNKRCWEVEGTLCSYHGIQIVREDHAGKEKEVACARSYCIYYEAVKPIRLTADMAGDLAGADTRLPASRRTGEQPS